ncbi:LuxR family transcriptional regulator [Sulfitobacter undariae]|uniref:LuxR family transcriptional regulator n=1 Tax=Sulfitobacter undariae TaxID=1563671 RepID=A0A7W6ED07_9RHOB|nr:LuxR family transcriptional regulator [Sulfitobacter undariae]MBB3995938.1 LuxR family transcriptional regulator [Sulfitobacter undariae]
MLPSLIPDYENEMKVLNEIGNAGVIMMFGFSFEGTEFLYSTYPKEWMDVYKEKAYFGLDPTVVWALSNSGTRRWSDLEIPDIGGVMQHAKCFRLKYGGVSSQRYGMSKSFLGIARHDRDLTDAELAHVSKKFKSWAPLLLKRPDLTQAEIDVLSCLKEGLAQREIAQKLNIAESTVKQRALRVCGKLGAVNRTHAVAIAVARNFVS